MVGRLVRILLSTAFAGITWGAVAAIPAAERQVLLDLYSATNGAGWTGVTPAWTAPLAAECAWGGVTCDAGQTTVLEINLSVRNLVGTLPTSINQLWQPAQLHCRRQPADRRHPDTHGHDGIADT